MVRKITTQELRIGMKIVDLNLPWLSNPFLFSEEKILSTQNEIDRIIADGFLETYIDTKEEIEAINYPKESASASAPQKDKIPPKVAIEKELPVARMLYDDSVRFARKTMQEISTGAVLPMADAERLIEDVLNSVTRNYNALLGLVKLRTRDEYTYTHSVNVGVLAVILARQLGLPEEESKRMGIAGLFHDIGKTRIPNEILNSAHKLTQEEWEIMKSHPQLGLENLDKTQLYPEVIHGILEHHEKVNGQGYPLGLKGTEISLVGRILSVVDVYDALTSRRSYKDPMLPHQALSLMYTLRDEEFEAEIIDSFIRSQGIYPVGSVVELNSGWRGVVMQVNPDKPLAPHVALLRSPTGKNVYGNMVNLATQANLKVIKVMGAEQAGVDPSIVLPGTSGSPLLKARTCA